MKISKINLVTNNQVATLELTDDLLEKIVKFNGYLSKEEIRQYLSEGKSVFTSFSEYRKIEA